METHNTFASLFPEEVEKEKKEKREKCDYLKSRTTFICGEYHIDKTMDWSHICGKDNSFVLDDKKCKKWIKKCHINLKEERRLKLSKIEK